MKLIRKKERRKKEEANIVVCVVNAACRSKQFECSDGSCIPLYQRCDDVAHCRDGDDELNCTAMGEYRHRRCFCLFIGVFTSLVVACC